MHDAGALAGVAGVLDRGPHATYTAAAVFGRPTARIHACGWTSLLFVQKTRPGQVQCTTIGMEQVYAGDNPRQTAPRMTTREPCGSG